MPANQSTEALLPLFGDNAAASWEVDEYALFVEAARSGNKLEVTVSGSVGRLVYGSYVDFATLLEMLDADRDRMIAEIVADAADGKLGDVTAIKVFGDLDDFIDANVYVSGGRSPLGARGDELHDWSDARTDEHKRGLLANGVIGKGVEVIDPEDISASVHFVGFQNAATTAVSTWIGEGGLSRAMDSLARAPGCR
jgi:hypothetical protein